MRRGTFWSPVPPGTVAVVGLPRPDEKSPAGTRCTSASHHLGARDRSFLNKMHVFQPGVRELSGLDEWSDFDEDVVAFNLDGKGLGVGGPGGFLVNRSGADVEMGGVQGTGQQV